MSLQELSMLLLRLSNHGIAAKYVGFGFRRFLESYARGHHDDGAVWSRRIAEAFCITATHPSAHQYLLNDLIKMLPDEISWPTAYSFVQHRRDRLYETARRMGLHLTQRTVWHDLKRMQRYGNHGTHAHGYLSEEPAVADPEAFLATVRIAIVFVHLYAPPGSKI